MGTTQVGYPLTREEAVYFRDQLRQARAAAASDAEGYQEILYCLERLGSKLTKKIGDLGAYKGAIRNAGECSPLMQAIPDEKPEYHTEFGKLYNSVREGRNDALHQGAVARRLTTQAVELALILEDAVMKGSTKDPVVVGDFMVREPTCAYPWQPISFIRQTMLVNSFSYLPVLLMVDQGREWRLIADYAIARYLNSSSQETPKQRLVRTLDEAIAAGEIKSIETALCTVKSPVTKALQYQDGRPALVRREGTDDLLGIVAPFDLL